jgi:hypothetical protein
MQAIMISGKDDPKAGLAGMYLGDGGSFSVVHL